MNRPNPGGWLLVSLAASALSLLLGEQAALAQSMLWRVTPNLCANNPSDCGCDKRRLGALVAIQSCQGTLNELKDGDRIEYECDRLPAGCSETGPVEIQGVRNVEVVAQPTRSVAFRATANREAMVVAQDAPGWTFDGFVFDGASSGVYTVVRVMADRTTIRRSRIVNGAGNSCLQIAGARGGKPERAQPVHNFTLEGSEVSNCVRGDVRTHDVHCIQSYSGVDMVIRDNHIWNCQGDGIQLENDYDDAVSCENQTGGCAAGLWRGVTISGNVFESKPDDVLAVLWREQGGEGIRPGENAVDLKAGGGYVAIRGNVMKGYRGWDPVEGDPVAGMGRGSGTGAQGAALSISGPFVECERAGDVCVTVEGNDISDSNGAAVVSTNVWQFGNIGTGRTNRVVLRRNVIHDMSGDAEQNPGLEERGFGIRYGIDIDNVVAENNTLVNLPGNAFVVDQGHRGAGNRIANSVVAYAGYFGGPGGCQSSVYYGGSFLVPASGNFCVPAGDPRGECSEGVDNSSFAEADLALAADPGAIRPLVRPEACGEDPIEEPGAYDYALGAGSLAIDRTGQSAATGTPGQPTCSRMGLVDPVALYDTGAKEYCADKSVRLDFNLNTGLLELRTTDYHRLSSEFVFGQGSYADAMTLDGLPNAFCGEQMTTTECLYYTKRCKDVCGLLPSGEVDCSCISNVDKQLGLQAPAPSGMSEIRSVLWIDKQQDGIFDESREPYSRDPNTGNPFRSVGSSRVSDIERTLEWEDLDVNPDEGDRNDFIASVKALSCTTDGASQAARFPEAPSCIPEQSPCQVCSNKGAEELGLSYAVSADDCSDGVCRASMREGRKLYVTVNVWRALENPSATPWEPRVAVCPMLEFTSQALVQKLNYHGRAACGGDEDEFDGIPDCHDVGNEFAKISLARRQYTEVGSQVCSVLPQNMDFMRVDDSFVLEPAKKCGNVSLPSLKTVTFELSWDQLMAALPPLTIEPTTSNAELLDHINALHFYVFTDIKSIRFMCPSGVNVALQELDGVDPRMATISRLKVLPSDFSIRPRE